MTKRVLLDYLQGIAPVEKLASDLQDSQKKTGYDTVSVSVKPLDKTIDFTVTKSHLLNLCNDMIIGKLSSSDITTIAFAIICSESFSWNKNTQEDEVIVDTTLYDWDNPEIGYPLTLGNMKRWKQYLETGIYDFSTDELK